MPETISSVSSRDQKTTYSELVRTLQDRQKTNKGASAYARWVNRPAGRRLAALAYLAGLTPNQVTGLSALSSAGGLVLIAAGPATVLTGLAASLLLVLGYALDAADGALARLRGGGTFAGEWLDHVVDAAKMSLVHLAVLIGWWKGYGLAAEWLAVPLAYEVIAVVFFFTIVLTDQLRRAHRGSSQMRLAGEGSSSVAYSFAVLPTEYGVLALTFAVWGVPEAFVACYLLLFAANAAFIALALPKWYREMKAFGQAGEKRKNLEADRT